MGAPTRSEIEQRLLGASFEGAANPSADPADPRGRRSLSAEIAFDQRYNRQHFEIRDGRLSLALQRRPAARRIQVPMTTGSATLAAQSVNLGGVNVWHFDSVDALRGRVVAPTDMNRDVPFRIHYYYGLHTASTTTPGDITWQVIVVPIPDTRAASLSTQAVFESKRKTAQFFEVDHTAGEVQRYTTTWAPGLLKPDVGWIAVNIETTDIGQDSEWFIADVHLEYVTTSSSHIHERVD